MAPETCVLTSPSQSVVATASAVKGTLMTCMPAANSHTLRLMGGMMSLPVSMVTCIVLVVVLVSPTAKVCFAANLTSPVLKNGTPAVTLASLEILVRTSSALC